MHDEQHPGGVSAGPPTAARDDDLVSVADELDTAEAGLDEQEKKARTDGATADVLAGFADARDALAARRDALAARYDERALRRDADSMARDGRSAARDLRSREIEDDCDPGFADRFLSAHDRDEAAGDRADAGDDRARGVRDRERAARDRDRARHDRRDALAQVLGLEQQLGTLKDALATRNIIGQAQGLLISQFHVDADEAFSMLVRLSQQTQLKLREVAVRLVQRTLGDHRD